MMANKEVVVQKYGGTSVATPERIGRVADYIAKVAEDKNIVVVISAMGEETDRLLRLAKEVYGGEPPKGELDKLLVTGEDQSAPLLTSAIMRRGRTATSLDSRAIGLVCDPKGRVKGVRDVSKIKMLLDQEQVVIITGYQGIVEETGEVSTLGRGGSEITTVALAAALGVGRCEVYSDVDGIYATDPRIVPAKRFDKISYEQLVPLAGAGGGKLMARSVKLAEKLGVEIKVLLSPSFGQTTGGTLVCSGSTLEKMEGLETQAGIAVRELRLIKVSNIPHEPGMANQIFEAISDIVIRDVVQPPPKDQAEISLLCLPEYSSIILSRLHGVKESGAAGEIKPSDPLIVAGLTLVDTLMEDESGYLARITRALARIKVNIEMLFSSGIAISVVVKEESYTKATQALAEEFGLLA